MQWVKKIRLAAMLACLGLAAPFSAYAQQTDNNLADPYQNYNRHMYTINDTVDRAVFKPVAILYQTVTPHFLQDNITNFFANLDELPTIVNDFLQGNTYAGGRDTWRFVTNSTLGAAGLFDVASKLGFPKNQQDFGLTLAHYGYVSSSYLVLPILGPSTVRDTIGLAGDYPTSIYPYMTHTPGYVLEGLDVVNARANLLRYNNLQMVLFDPYIATRNAYQQTRARQVAQVRAAMHSS